MAVRNSLIHSEESRNEFQITHYEEEKDDEQVEYDEDQGTSNIKIKTSFKGKKRHSPSPKREVEHENLKKRTGSRFKLSFAEDSVIE